jgi:uncharacterized RDD family membrane protein YckC
VSSDPESRSDVLPFPPASPGKRLAGALIDGLLFAVLALSTLSTDTSNGVGLGLAWLGISALYEIGLTAARGQTLGKMAVGTQVVDVSGERLPSWGQAALRWLVQGVPNIVGVVVVSSAVDLASLVWATVIYLPILRSLDRRGWHDRLAGTIVIDRRLAASD